jgi:hypothetical protein
MRSEMAALSLVLEQADQARASLRAQAVATAMVCSA